MQLHVLSKSEAYQFDQPPEFNSVQRNNYFYISDLVKELINPLRKPWTQVGFLLQWGYFRYTDRFFSVERFQDNDIQFLIQQLKVDISVEDVRKNYISTVIYEHRTTILRALGHADFDSKKQEFDYELNLLVAKRLRPKQIFGHLVQYLKARRVALPTAHFLINAITHAFRHFEEQLRSILAEDYYLRISFTWINCSRTS